METPRVLKPGDCFWVRSRPDPLEVAVIEFPEVQWTWRFRQRRSFVVRVAHGARFRVRDDDGRWVGRPVA